MFNQLIRQTDIHQASEPIRSVSNAVVHETVERAKNYLAVAKDMIPLNNRLLAAEEYDAIDVNQFMEGLDSMARYRFTSKLKAGLSTPFHIWSWKRGNNAGISTHFIWKIPSKNYPQARADGESKVAAIVGDLTLNQERHFGRAVMSTYLGAIVGPDFIHSKCAAKAVWQFITGCSVDAGCGGNAIAATWALHSCDKGIVMDMRAMNGKTKDPAYDHFWEELSRQLETYKTVHSRRHAGNCQWFPNVLAMRIVLNIFYSCALWYCVVL